MFLNSLVCDRIKDFIFLPTVQLRRTQRRPSYPEPELWTLFNVFLVVHWYLGCTHKRCGKMNHKYIQISDGSMHGQLNAQMTLVGKAIWLPCLDILVLENVFHGCSIASGHWIALYIKAAKLPPAWTCIPISIFSPRFARILAPIVKDKIDLGVHNLMRTRIKIVAPRALSNIKKFANDTEYWFSYNISDP